MSILEDTANRRLRMQCSEICLAKSGTDPITAKGAGTVWTDEAGQLRFECELSKADFVPYARAMERHVRQLPEEPGDDDYWQLTAVSTSGDIYQGRVLYAEDESRDENRFPETLGKAKGKLHQLRSTRESEETGLDLVTLLVPRKIDFPRIWYPEGISSKDHCRIRLDNEQIELFERQTYTTIVCALAPGGIATNRHWRMIEAIEFAFGQSICPCAMETRKGAETVTALYSPSLASSMKAPWLPCLISEGPPCIITPSPSWFESSIGTCYPTRKNVLP
jgi:hypothetical protein